MSIRPDQLTLSLGTDALALKASLTAYVTDRQVYGRNAVPSISEMVQRIAAALEFDYEQAACLLDQVMILAGTAVVVEGEE